MTLAQRSQFSGNGEGESQAGDEMMARLSE